MAYWEWRSNGPLKHSVCLLGAVLRLVASASCSELHYQFITLNPDKGRAKNAPLRMFSQRLGASHLFPVSCFRRGKTHQCFSQPLFGWQPLFSFSHNSLKQNGAHQPKETGWNTGEFCALAVLKKDVLRVATASQKELEKGVHRFPCHYVTFHFVL